VNNVAVIGIGKFGQYHAEKYSQIPGVNLCLVDIHKERAERLAEKLGATFTNDYRTLTNMDYVSVVTPDETHHEVAKHFIRSKANVLIEKPMTINLDDADQLFVLAKLYEVKLLIGHLERFNSEYLQIKQGKCLMADCNPKYIKAWRSNNGRDYDRENCDVVTDLMLHDIDLILDLVGEPIKYIQAKGLKNDLGKHYYAKARVVFANGVIADLTADRISKGKHAIINIISNGHNHRIDLLKKSNDTLADELNHFLNGAYSNFQTAREALRVAFDIMESIR
jgi:predicted dehydrogenase